MSENKIYPEVRLYEIFKKLYEQYKVTGKEIEEEHKIEGVGIRKFHFGSEASQKFEELNLLLQTCDYELSDKGLIGEGLLIDNIIYSSYIIWHMIRGIQEINQAKNNH